MLYEVITRTRQGHPRQTGIRMCVDQHAAAIDIRQYRRANNLMGRPDAYDPPLLHHQNAIAILAGQIDVMRDHHHCHMQLLVCLSEDPTDVIV